MAVIVQNKNDIWPWLIEHRESGQTPAFTAESFTGTREPWILDELWSLAGAGILRPEMGLPQFVLTAVGVELTQDENSPYSDSFYSRTLGSASDIDEDSKGFFRMALDCLRVVPPASVALFRAALEREIDSLIDAYEASAKQGNVRPLHQRDLGKRIEELVKRIKSKQITEIDDELLVEFSSCCSLVRIPANRVLHSSGGLSSLDATEVSSVSHSFRRMAELSTEIKRHLIR